MFGTKPFFRSNLSLVPVLFGYVVFFVRALLIFCVSACVVLFLWVPVCFFAILVVILGLSFLRCSVLMLNLLLHVLAARLPVGFFGLRFDGSPPGGSFGYGQPARVNIFVGFSHNRGVWVKTGAVPQGEGFCKLFCFKNVHLRGQHRRPLSILSQGMLQKLGFHNFIKTK